MEVDQTKALTVPEAGEKEVIPGYGSAAGFELLQRGASSLGRVQHGPGAATAAICLTASWRSKWRSG